jgi:hypothetical protein
MAADGVILRLNVIIALLIVLLLVSVLPIAVAFGPLFIIVFISISPVILLAIVQLYD